MTKLRVGITTLISLFASFPAFAEMGIDEKINLAIKPYADAVAGFVFSSFPVAGVQIPFVLVWLIVAATIFTFYFNFINLRAFRHGFELVRGDYHDPKAAGEVTHFQALATALSGTVGLGNIAGVAVAAVLFLRQQYLVRDRDRDACFQAFLNNNWVGVAIWAGLLAAYAMG